VKRRSERGQTAVEFALVIPVMILFLLAIFQVGQTFFNNEDIATAARDGARSASIHTGSTEAQIINYANVAIKGQLAGIDQSKIVINVNDATTPHAYAQGDTVDVVVTYPWKIGVMAFSQSGTLTAHTQLIME
jgi:Flp pilus assembly protein TadG